MTPTEARALWYVATTGGTTSEISDTLNLGEIPTMGILLRLQDQGLVKMVWMTKGQYQWMLTTRGLAEHERRMNRANRTSAGDT